MFDFEFVSRFCYIFVVDVEGEMDKICFNFVEFVNIVFGVEDYDVGFFVMIN